MYRQYEDPHKLEEELREAEQELENAISAGVDEDTLIGLHERKEDLRERVNFAWQDDEAEAMGWE